MPSGIYKRTEKQIRILKKHSFKNGYDKRRFWKGDKHIKKWKLTEGQKKVLSNAKKLINPYWLIGCDKRNTKKRQLKIGEISISERIRKHNRYKQWRKAVFKRDNWTCQECQRRGVRLEADHIVSLAEILLEIKKKFGQNNLLQKAIEYKPLFDISNGCTLCRECHRKTPTWGGNNKMVYSFSERIKIIPA